jgi:hypothetical protein
VSHEGSFSDFWLILVRQHRHPVHRALHFLSNTAVFGLWLYALASQTWFLLLLGPVVGYVPSWFGHFAFERNEPAAWEHPLWSHLCGLRMGWLIATFQMGRELRWAAEAA